MGFRDFVKAILASIVDIKHQLVMISTVLFYLDKMSEVGWITFVLSVTGFRLASEIVDMVKEVKSVVSIKTKE
jgi:uncharacterized membrane protein